ncbi:hypothetical protein [Octadecabacter sp. R77987]|uniref:hypothetical protein n=1 Tax=Octadecabacter sp. R77987 TaxID=3093874 RepID=UPI00366D6F6D
MAGKFEVRTQAEKFIHNDLSNCAYSFEKSVGQKISSGETEGVYHDMMAALVFTAFSIEAMVNFVGWKVLENGWPERANLREKVDLLSKVLDLELDWGTRPLQTINQLKRFRDTIARGKPEVVDETTIVEVEPAVWDALKGQWEESVTPDFVKRCLEDEGKLWKMLLKAAEIQDHENSY